MTHDRSALRRLAASLLASVPALSAVASAPVVAAIHDGTPFSN